MQTAHARLTGLQSDGLAGTNVTLSCRRGDVDEPIRVLETEEEYRPRGDTAEALGGTHDHRAVEPQIATFRYRSADERAEVAEALGTIGDHRARGPLTEPLDDPERDVREEVMRVLERPH